MASKRTLLGLIPVLILSFVVWVALLLCTISLPTTLGDATPFYWVGSNIKSIPRIDGPVNATVAQTFNGVRLGTWGACFKNVTADSYSYCTQDNHHGYELQLSNQGVNLGQAYNETTIKSSWTRGLVVIVVALVFGIISFVVACVPKWPVMKLISAVGHLLTFLLALIAFAIQIALFVYTKNRMNRIFVDVSTMPGPSFYITLVTLPVLLFISISLLLLWRSEKRASSTPASYSYGGANASSSYDYSSNAATTPGAAKDTYEMGESKEKGRFLGKFGGSKSKAEQQDSRSRVLEAFQKS